MHHKLSVDLTHEFYEMMKRDEFLLAKVGDQVKPHLLYPEKFLKLKDGRISARLENDRLVLEADTYVKGVELSVPGVSGAIFNDNYFDLIPGHTKYVSLIERKDGNQIRIKGLNSEEQVIELD